MSPLQILLTFLILLFHFHIQDSSSFTLSVENLEHDIIASPKGTFTAGFYPTGENAYTFAIWFTQKHKHLINAAGATVVWMANRDHPVNGKRSTLSLLKTGNLVLTDAGQFNVWSTNTVSSKPLELFLFDTGNLVLREHNQNGFVLWQSFDFPTDTLLPDQRFTIHMKLVSSKSNNDCSSGFYKLFFDNDNLLRLLYDGPRVSSVYWPDPLELDWQGERSTYNSTRVATLDHMGNFSSSDDFTFKTSDYGTLLHRRITIDFDGNVRFYSRQDNEQEKWLITGHFLQQPCHIHGICGPNSICSYDPRTGRKCSCLPGYSMINNQDWSQGCKPSFKFSCKNKTNSRFKFLPRVEFYDYDYMFKKNYTFKQCKHLCLRLCECIAFQYRYVKNKGLFNCYPKTQLLNGRRSTNFRGSLFLQMPKNDNLFTYENDNLICSRKNSVKQLGRSYVNAKENASVKFMVWFAIGLGGVEVLCFFVVYCLLFKNRKHDDRQGYVLAAATGFRKFSYLELKQATKGFSQEIGRGAGGIVFKGVLSDKRVVAIKRLHDANQGEGEFLAEVSIIGRLNHMNLIGMWGYCAEGKHRLLVYEYMENGTLADNLSSKEFDWSKRYNIAMGTAKCLAYLHEECLEWILHCDIKPQNILVDSNYQPKVADFGLSKLLNRGDFNNSSFSSNHTEIKGKQVTSCMNFSRIRGTRGYMAPEWIFNLEISSKVDVYSYGVVVLEMVTGKNPTIGIEIKDGEELRLARWVREKRRKGFEVNGCWVEQIVDPNLGSNYDVKKMETLTNVALDCVAEEKNVRPTMRQVVERLLSHVDKNL